MGGSWCADGADGDTDPSVRLPPLPRPRRSRRSGHDQSSLIETTPIPPVVIQPVPNPARPRTRVVSRAPPLDLSTIAGDRSVSTSGATGLRSPVRRFESCRGLLKIGCDQGELPGQPGSRFDPRLPRLTPICLCSWGRYGGRERPPKSPRRRGIKATLPTSPWANAPIVRRLIHPGYEGSTSRPGHLDLWTRPLRRVQGHHHEQPGRSENLGTDRRSRLRFICEEPRREVGPVVQPDSARSPNPQSRRV
jgi:hypothetical protein